MSRLIFEGDTIERFGAIFPKPFIEEVRVYNDHIETDIGLYFEIEEGVTAEQFIDNTGLQKLKVYVGPLTKVGFDRALRAGTGLSFYAGAKIREALDGGEFTSLVLQNGSYRHSFFYNSDGDKFVKFILTDDTWNYDTSNGEQYLISMSFFEDVERLGVIEEGDPLLENAKLLQNQYSAVSYEKVFNEDGSLNIGPTVSYIDSDNVFYGSTPIMTLGARYRKSTPIGHVQISQRIQPLITPLVGTVAEADMISMTLQTYSNDPQLLLELKNNINSFTNKSSTTTIGTLYNQLVDVVASLNSLIETQEPLQKRQILNQKIVDFTEDRISLNYYSINLQPAVDEEDYYISTPYGSRQWVPIKKTEDLSGDIDNANEEVAIANKSYHFFDYQRAIYYDSEISRFLNIYNLYQIFNEKGLDNYFRVVKVALKKTMTDGAGLLDAAGDVYAETPETIDKVLIRLEPDDNNILTSMFYKYDVSENNISFIKNFENNQEGEIMFSHIAERAFDTVAGNFENYKMKFFEAVEFERAIQNFDNPSHQLVVTVDDRTMEFYKEHIYDRLMRAYDNFESYAGYAEEFCSYNNIDGRFNDFFTEGVERTFEEPYPWIEAPLVFLTFRALLEASYTSGDFYSSPYRRTDGTTINETTLLNGIKLLRSRVSPISGDLQSVANFRQLFEDLKNIFERGTSNSTLDASRIFDPSDDDLVLKNPTLEVKYRSSKLALGRPSHSWDYFDTTTYVEDPPKPPPVGDVAFDGIHLEFPIRDKGLPELLTAGGGSGGGTTGTAAEDKPGAPDDDVGDPTQPNI
jgi:hypothetical protein